ARRVEAVTRIEEAAGGLDERMQDLAVQIEEYDRLHKHLRALVQSMLYAEPADVTPDTVPSEQAA
ncbi:MAG: hypothetical protein Q8M78_09165, partial [Burkholderiaceae bacterium]|nr:hypothetical protein [Burkholderiaceae bacterium]